MTRLMVLGLVAWALSACRGDDRQPATPSAAVVTAPRASPQAPDSEYDIAVQLRRFRDAIADHPTTLAHATASRDALVRRFVRAVEAADTAALERLQLSAGEFAYFYYPDSRLSRPPYELEPQLMWQQIQAHGDRGREKLLRRFAGKALGFRSLECPRPQREGESLLHECSVRHAAKGTGQPLDERLFGTILERRGRFKFVSYANRL